MYKEISVFYGFFVSAFDTHKKILVYVGAGKVSKSHFDTLNEIILFCL